MPPLLLRPARVTNSTFFKQSGSEWSEMTKEEKQMGTERERKDTQIATIYELRLLIKKSGKDYTNQELCDLLDTIAEAKAQE